MKRLAWLVVAAISLVLVILSFTYKDRSAVRLGEANDNNIAILDKPRGEIGISNKPEGRDRSQLPRDLSQFSPNPSAAAAFAEKIHRTIQATSVENKWSTEAERRLTLLTKDISYQTKPATVKCGLNQCEVIVYIQGNISEDNKRNIVNRLASPQYDHSSDAFFTLRQIWSNKDILKTEPSLYAFYTKRE